MARAVITQKDLPDLAKYADDIPGKIIKFIPGESVAAYLGIDQIVHQLDRSEGAKQNLLWVVFLVILVGTPFYLRSSQAPKQPTVVQVGITCVAFVIWVASLGGPFVLTWDAYDTVYASIAILLFTFAVPIIYNPQPTETKLPEQGEG